MPLDLVPQPQRSTSLEIKKPKPKPNSRCHSLVLSELLLAVSQSFHFHCMAQAEHFEHHTGLRATLTNALILWQKPAAHLLPFTRSCLDLDPLSLSEESRQGPGINALGMCLKRTSKEKQTLWKGCLSCDRPLSQLLGASSEKQNKAQSQPSGSPGIWTERRFTIRKRKEDLNNCLLLPTKIGFICSIITLCLPSVFGFCLVGTLVS